MLRVFDNIADGVQRSTATALPLLVIIHDPLPAHTNNAREATTSEVFSFMHKNSLTANSNNDSTSMLNDSWENTSGHSYSVSGTSAAAAGGGGGGGDANSNNHHNRMSRFNKENAHLGKLRVSIDGPLNENFKLGELKGGIAQREAILVTLMSLRVGNVCFLHSIDAGTPAYANFKKAMPAQFLSSPQPQQNAEEAPSMPRVHVFPPVFFSQKESALSKSGDSGNISTSLRMPFALSGPELTPAALHGAVKMCLQLPLTEAVCVSGMAKSFERDQRYRFLLGMHSHNSNSSNSSVNAEDADTFVNAVIKMNAEGRRQQEADRLQRESLEARPLLPGGHHSVSSNNNSNSASKSNNEVRVASADANTNTNRSGLHLIHVDCLPPNGTRRKTLLTSVSMTVRTVWMEVEKSIDKCEAEVEEAKSSGKWDGVACDLQKGNFYLEVEAAEGNGVAVVMHTVEEANAVRLQSLASGATIHARRVGAVEPYPSAAKAEPTEKTKKEKTSGDEEEGGKHKARVVCDGDTCRRVPALPSNDEKAEGERQTNTKGSPLSSGTLSKRAKTENEEEEEDEGKSEANGATSAISIRCSLPDGRTETITGLSPATDTLRSRLRPVIVGLLNSNEFVFASSFPPPAKKFSLDTDEPLPLASIGLKSSCALRVVLTGAAAESAKSKNASAQSAQRNASGFPVNPADAAAASGILSQLMRMMRGEGSAQGNDSSNRAGSRVGSGGGGGGFRSMAEIRAVEEDDDREQARQQLAREQMQDYLQRQTKENSSSDSNTDTEEGRRQHLEAMSAFFQRFSQQQRQQQPSDEEKDKKKVNRYFGGDSTEYISAPTGPHAQPPRKGRKSENEENEEDDGDDDDEAGRQQQAGMRAFAGVGRRLADGQAVNASNSTASSRHVQMGAPAKEEEEEEEEEGQSQKKEGEK